MDARAIDEYDLGTVPERIETLRHQREQLIAGRRFAMLFPVRADGVQYVPLSLPPGAETHETPVGVFYYDPRHIAPDEIDVAVTHGFLNSVLNLGPFSKREIAQRIACYGEHPIAVVEIVPEGHEVRAAWGTLETAAQQLRYFNLTKTPGHECFVTSPLHVIAARLAPAKS